MIDPSQQAPVIGYNYVGFVAPMIPAPAYNYQPAEIPSYQGGGAGGEHQ